MLFVHKEQVDLKNLTYISPYNYRAWYSHGKSVYIISCPTSTSAIVCWPSDTLSSQLILILINQANSEENIEMRHVNGNQRHGGRDEDDMMTDMLSSIGRQYREGDDEEGLSQNSKDDDDESIASTGKI